MTGIVSERIDQILGLYEKALRDADSPLVTTADRWHQARRQAEAILSECVRVLDPTATEPSDPHVPTRELGISRAHEQILVADSIRAATLLWRAAVPVLREVLTTEIPEGRERLPDVLEALYEAISIRLYIGSVAHEHVRLAGRPSGSGRDHRSVSGPVAGPEDITEREREVLKCVSRALSNREIAKELAISEATVKAHLRNIFRKLAATSRVDALNKVGLVPQPPLEG
ncbi:helix-turn-helix transcriptional regulator [Microbispora sp. H10670]|uniref:helix-turn-helix transcriptional regulator n=1 Tax=Microbispora sp. H10670 TaxID=2729108 RepID=UPI00287300A1|nr:helix-turn-helix transcriptional regulator [Microbispora sp. H10670]